MLEVRYLKNRLAIWAGILLCISVLVSCVSYPERASADILRQLSFHGSLKTSGGNAVTDGSYDIVFKIYDASSGGNLLWTGTHTAGNGNAVSVDNGFFSVLLGSGTGNDLDLSFNEDTYYLGVTVASDSEMTPRTRIGAAAFALNADALDGYTSADFVRTDATSTIATSSADTLLTLNQEGSGDVFNAQVNGSEVFTITQSGSVGVGTTSPDSRLSVEGNIHLGNAGSGSTPVQLTFDRGATTTLTNTQASIGFVTNGSIDGTHEGWFFNTGAPNADYRFLSAGTDIMTLLSTGYLGIGTTNPAVKLVVETDGAINSVLSGAYGTGMYGQFLLYGARGTQAAPTSTQSGDIIGNISFQGFDTARSNGATIRGVAAAEWGTAGDSSDSPADLVFATAADGTQSLTDRMIITSTGLVGIGTSSPIAKLSVSGDTYLSGSLTTTATSTASYFAASTLGTTGAPAFTFSSDLNTGLWSSGADTLALSTGGTERITVTSTGNVGIGTTSPEAPLQVWGTQAVFGSRSTLGVAQGFSFLAASSTLGDTPGGDLTFGASGGFGTGGSGNIIFTTGSPQASTIVLDATSTTSGTPNTIVWNHTVGSCPNNDGILIIAASDQKAGAKTVSSTLSGSMTALQGGTGGGLHIYYVLNPVPGVDTLSYGSTGSTAQTALSGITYCGVNQTTPFGTKVFSSGTGTSIASSTQGGQILIDFLYKVNTDVPTQNAGQTALVRRLAGGTVTIDVSTASNTQPTMGWTWSSSATYAHAAVPLRSTNATVGSTFAERLRIDTNGKIGIGTSSPSFDLDIAKSIAGDVVTRVKNESASTTARAVLSVTNGESLNDGTSLFTTGTNYATSGVFYQDSATLIGDSGLSGGLAIGTANATADLRLFTGGTDALNERLRITSAGNVGIGTSTPDVKFQIMNTITGLSTGLKISPYHTIGVVAGTALQAVDADPTSYRILALNPSGGNVGIGTSTPDRNLVIDSGNSGTDVYVGLGNNGTRWLLGSETSLATDVFSIYDVNSTAYRMVIDDNGNVGIGTSTPTSKLTIADSGATPYTVLGNLLGVFRDTIPTGQTVSLLSTDDSSASDEYFIAMASEMDSAQDNEFLFRTDGTALADGSWNGGGADYAEYVTPKPGTDPEDYPKGSLICVYTGAPDSYGFCDNTNDSRVVGVISTFPAIVGNSPALAPNAVQREDTHILLSMLGRVPVRVSLENGPIEIGDRLAASSLPGIAMRATETARTVGFALEEYTDETSSSSIMMYIEPELTFIDIELESISELATFGELTSDEPLSPRMQNFVTGLFAPLTDWFASASNEIGDFFANRVRTKELCVADDSGETCLTRSELDALIIGADEIPAENSSGDDGGDSEPPIVETSPDEPEPPSSDEGLPPEEGGGTEEPLPESEGSEEEPAQETF